MTTRRLQSDHIKVRKRKDESSALRHEFRLARQNLRTKMPGQDDEVGRIQCSCLVSGFQLS